MGESVDHVLKYKQEYLEVEKGIASTDQIGSTKNKIESYLISYLGEQMIIAHFYFLQSYCRCWWNLRFQWYKYVEAQTKVARFLGCHIAVHYYLQHRDLSHLILNWKSHRELTDFV